MTLCVLMSVYNGEKYIRQQLDSIFSQEFDAGESSVYVRDDGSKDRTPDICWEYGVEHGCRIDVVRGENKGPAKSFLELINTCPDSDIYAFSDQDDVWLPGKVRTAAEKLNCRGSALWVSNYSAAGPDLSVIRETVLDKPETDPLRILFYNNVPGCVMMFNRALLEEMKKLTLTEFRMHDIFALDIAALTGEILFEPQVFLLYRQHAANVLGFGNKKITPKKWIADKLRFLRSDESYHFSDYAGKVLEVFGSRLSPEQTAEFQLIWNYRNSLWKTIKLLGRTYTHDGFNRTAVSIRAKILLRRV